MRRRESEDGGVSKKDVRGDKTGGHKEKKRLRNKDMERDDLKSINIEVE